jgi:hypothetical protein
LTHLSLCAMAGILCSAVVPHGAGVHVIYEGETCCPCYDSGGAGVHVIYDAATGNLFYDSDGGDALTGRIQFAHLTLSGGTFDQGDIKVGS